MMHSASSSSTTLPTPPPILKPDTPAEAAPAAASSPSSPPSPPSPRRRYPKASKSKVAATVAAVSAVKRLAPRHFVPALDTSDAEASYLDPTAYFAVQDVDDEDDDIEDPEDDTQSPQPTHEVEACPLPASRFESSLCEFQQAYSAFKQGLDLSPRVTGLKSSGGSSQDIFANADLPLSRISAFGFDFDYTLASYNDHVSLTIYELARDYLVESMGYPAALRARTFDASFAIRGLHFDTRTGFVLKIDQFAKVQTGCVYLGRRQVSIAEIIEAYRGVSLTKDYVDKYLHQLVDLFALSETTLLSDCIQTFVDGDLSFSPDYISKDVRRAVEFVHSSGVFHRRIMAAPDKFLAPSPRVGDFLLRLRDGRRFTFLLTNSPYAFVDRGMRFMLQGIERHPSAAKYGLRSSRDWTQLFDVTVTSARKPTWFMRDGRFRRVETRSSDDDGAFPEAEGLGGKLSWMAVEKFERGAVYTEGSLAEFTRLVSIERQQAAEAARSAAAATAAAHAAPSSLVHAHAHAATAAASASAPVAASSASKHSAAPGAASASSSSTPSSSAPHHPTGPVAASSSTAAAAPSLRGHEVLYFGDHVGADLTAPWLRARWRTVAIVRELEHEVAVQSSAKFKQALRRLLQVEALIDYGQRITDAETRSRLHELKRARQSAKSDLLALFNPHFGSVFRTSSHRTEFFSEVGRFSDCYTSSVTNFLHYSLDHTFYAKRIFFPHEINFALNATQLTAETAATDGDTFVDQTHTVPAAP